jgi:hypothetical protein
MPVPFVSRRGRLLVEYLRVQVNLTGCDLNGPRPFLAANRGRMAAVWVGVHRRASFRQMVKRF